MARFLDEVLSSNSSLTYRHALRYTGCHRIQYSFHR